MVSNASQNVEFNRALKLYLNESQVELFHEYARLTGKTDEWFDNWLKDAVIIVYPI